MALISSRSRLPARWGVGLIVLLICYALLQPQLSQRLGWALPSLADLLQLQPEPVPPHAGPSTAGSSAATNDSIPADSSPPASANAPSERQLPAGDAELRYGLLRQTGPNEFVSPAGLRYTPGSQEGHRLKHIARHLVDAPDRPGKHGVFDGDMSQVLRWLDEAYVLARRGGPAVDVHQEDGRTVYEVRFPKPIGYIGGRDGGRRHHPDARQIRLVLDGDRVITAFPF